MKKFVRNERAWREGLFEISLTFPPPAACWILSREPHLAWTWLKSSLTLGIMTWEWQGDFFFFFIHTQTNAANTEGFSNWMGVGSLKIAPILFPLPKIIQRKCPNFKSTTSQSVGVHFWCWGCLNCSCSRPQETNWSLWLMGLFYTGIKAFIRE